MTDKTGGPAFPMPMTMRTAEHIANEPEYGITMRDYFAAKAMQGMLAACSGWSEGQQERLAKCSYAMADEMISARSTDKVRKEQA